MSCHNLRFWVLISCFMFNVYPLVSYFTFHFLPLSVSCVQLCSSPWTEARVCFVCLFCSCVSLLFPDSVFLSCFTWVCCLHPPVAAACTLICFWVVLGYLLNNFFPDVCCPFLSNLTPGIWTTGPNRLGMNTPYDPGWKIQQVSFKPIKGGFKRLDPGYMRPLPLSTFASCVTRPSYFSSADFSPASFYPSSSIRWSSWILSSLSMAFLGHLMCFFIHFRTLRTPQKTFQSLMLAAVSELFQSSRVVEFKHCVVVHSSSSRYSQKINNILCLWWWGCTTSSSLYFRNRSLPVRWKLLTHCLSQTHEEAALMGADGNVPL